MKVCLWGSERAQGSHYENLTSGKRVGARPRRVLSMKVCLRGSVQTMGAAGGRKALIMKVCPWGSVKTMGAEGRLTASEKPSL
jgi:hypothetical protein